MGLALWRKSRGKPKQTKSPPVGTGMAEIGVRASGGAGRVIAARNKKAGNPTPGSIGCRRAFPFPILPGAEFPALKLLLLDD